MVRMRAALRLQYYIMNALKANTLAGRKRASETSLKRDHENISPSPQAAAVAVAIATAAPLPASPPPTAERRKGTREKDTA